MCPRCKKYIEDDEEGDRCSCLEQAELAKAALNSDAIAHCNRCGKYHDWDKGKYLDCRPPLSVLRFGGTIILDRSYRAALDAFCSLYTTEEIVGSYLGRNPHFPSQEKWFANGCCREPPEEIESD